MSNKILAPQLHGAPGGVGVGVVGLVGGLNLAKKSGNGEVSYAKGDTSINAKLDTTNAAILEEVELTHGLKVQGKSLTLTPKYVSEGQKGSLSARLALNDATTLEVEGEAEVRHGLVEEAGVAGLVAGHEREDLGGDGGGLLQAPAELLVEQES